MARRSCPAATHWGWSGAARPSSRQTASAEVHGLLLSRGFIPSPGIVPGLLWGLCECSFGGEREGVFGGLAWGSWCGLTSRRGCSWGPVYQAPGTPSLPRTNTARALRAARRSVAVSDHTEAPSTVTEAKPPGPTALPHGHFPGDAGMSEGPSRNILNGSAWCRGVSPGPSSAFPSGFAERERLGRHEVLRLARQREVAAA